MSIIWFDILTFYFRKYCRLSDTLIASIHCFSDNRHRFSRRSIHFTFIKDAACIASAISTYSLQSEFITISLIETLLERRVITKLETWYGNSDIGRRGGNDISQSTETKIEIYPINTCICTNTCHGWPIPCSFILFFWYHSYTNKQVDERKGQATHLLVTLGVSSSNSFVNDVEPGIKLKK